MRDKPVLEFWFDFGSNYSYLAAMRIDALAKLNRVEVAWKPFLLGPLFKRLGWTTSPFVIQREKGAYVWRDMERESERLNIAWTRPSAFPRGSLLGHRVAVAAAGEPWQPAFCQSLFKRNFVADMDIEGPDAVGDVLAALGQSANDWIGRATTEESKLALRRQTDLAHARGVFGAPTFFTEAEMFWGNDRLESAFEWATRRALRPAPHAMGEP